MKSRYFCPNYCGKSYKNKCSIKRHLKFECEVEPKIECHICRFKDTFKGMRKHFLETHQQYAYNIQ